MLQVGDARVTTPRSPRYFRTPREALSFLQGRFFPTTRLDPTYSLLKQVTKQVLKVNASDNSTYTASVTSLWGAFSGATAANPNEIGHWNVSSVTDMHSMFLFAS